MTRVLRRVCINLYWIDVFNINVFLLGSTVYSKSSTNIGSSNDILYTCKRRYEIPFFDIIYDFILWYSIEYQYNFLRESVLINAKWIMSERISISSQNLLRNWKIPLFQWLVRWKVTNMHVFLADMSCVNVNVVVPNTVKCDSSNKNHFSTQIRRKQSTYNLIHIIYRSKMSSELPIIVVCSEGAKTSQEIINSEKIFD